jgi:hypothetical protein
MIVREHDCSQLQTPLTIGNYRQCDHLMVIAWLIAEWLLDANRKAMGIWMIPVEIMMDHQGTDQGIDGSSKISALRGIPEITRLEYTDQG